MTLDVMRKAWYPAPGEYLKAMRRAEEITAAGGKVQFYWSSGELDAAGLQEERFRALDKRINKKGAEIHLLNTHNQSRSQAPVTGRKLSYDYQTSLRRDARRVADRLQRRIIVRQFETPEISARFAQLIFEED